MKSTRNFPDAYYANNIGLCDKFDVRSAGNYESCISTQVKQFIIKSTKVRNSNKKR